MLLAAVGIDGNGEKHPLGVIEGATENTAVVQALLDNLVGRGLEAAVCRLFIIDGAKALSKAIRNTFGRHTPIQRCQVHKARNITERLAKPLHASVRKALRQAWELDDADKAERLIGRRLRRSSLRLAAQSKYKGVQRVKAHKQKKGLTQRRGAQICAYSKHWRRRSLGFLLTSTPPFKDRL